VSLEPASGVILRTRLLTDTSLIVHWLTPEYGRLATVAQGARRPKSPFRGKLDLWFEASFSFQRRRRSDLHFLREVVLTETHRALRTRLANVRQAAYAALLLEIATEPEAAVPELHRLFCELLACLGAAPALPQRLLAFELQLLAASGLAVPLAQARLRPATQHLAEALTTTPLIDLAPRAVDPAATAELDRFLARFLADHLGRLPRGRHEALAAPDGPVSSPPIPPAPAAPPPPIA
jgi:DNA repair protein RecO (recombination protein O)